MMDERSSDAIYWKLMRDGMRKRSAGTDGFRESENNGGHASKRMMCQQPNAGQDQGPADMAPGVARPIGVTILKLIIGGKA